MKGPDGSSCYEECWGAGDDGKEEVTGDEGGERETETSSKC